MLKEYKQRYMKIRKCKTKTSKQYEKVNKTIEKGKNKIKNYMQVNIRKENIKG